jgi:hypothetical protein
MSQARLRPCPQCARHVRVSEATCAFCGVVLEPSFRAAPPPIAPSTRLSRAALFAFGAGTAALAPAVMIDCATPEATYASIAPPYGAEPFPDAGEYLQDGGTGRVLPDVTVASPDASDGSAAAADASDAGDGSVESADVGDGSVESEDGSDDSLDGAPGTDGAGDDAEGDASDVG